MKGLQVTQGRDGCVFAVHVVPKGRRDAVIGLYGDALKIRLKAPPVKGQANRALQSFLADHLGVTADAVQVLSGHTSRHKVVRVTGVEAAQVHALLEGAG
jgi:uncharacterized protein (TIGR00251 family)